MENTKTIGRYEILEELGHGAMGTVYRAKDPAMDRIVALKTVIAVALASEQGSEFRERFYREARAAGRLAHPGIVPVFDVGEHAGLPFLVMEFIDGQTLADAVKKGERLTLERACEIAQQIAEALGYAHQNGVIHRDIKPANILLTSRDIYGIARPKITDFGVAKLAAGQITTSGQLLGTPAFMPPEQFTGSALDGRADLFSLGVILYWMTTGEQPFPGETMTAVSYKVVHTEPVPPGKLNPAIPAALDNLILKCIAKNPAERYQTGEELAQALVGVRTLDKTQLQSSTPQRPQTGKQDDVDTQMTMDVRSTSQPAKPSTIVTSAPVTSMATPNSTIPNSGAKPFNTPLISAGIAAVVVIALGGWFLLRNKNVTSQSVAQIPAVSSVPVAIPPVSVKPAVSSNNPVSSSSTSNSPPSNVGISNNAAKREDANVAANSAAPKTPRPPREPAAVDFDPRSLNPKENSKLKIDASKIPAAMDFAVEMNGKTYFRRSAAETKAEYDNLFVPPGVQEFHVTVTSRGAQKSSNIVSTAFKAKKKETLKIELRSPDGHPPKGTPQELSPDAQIFVTLK